MSVITGNIDVTKIEKARLFEGKKGVYLDIVIFLNQDKDQYENNGMIAQSVSQEERESGIKGPILGNVRIVKADEPYESIPEDGESIPF